MAFLSLTGGTWLRKTIVGAGIGALVGLGGYAFAAVDNRYVKSDRYDRDRLSDSLRFNAQMDRGAMKDSILNAKMDEALLRLQQIQCGRRVVEGCR